jgi:hypothetical protein
MRETLMVQWHKDPAWRWARRFSGMHRAQTLKNPRAARKNEKFC